MASSLLPLIARDAPISLAFQTVLYRTEAASVERALDSLVNAVRVAQAECTLARVEILYGDCSEQAVFAQARIDELNAKLPNGVRINYTHFGQNLGTAAGHNRLFERASTDLCLIANPDVLFEGSCLAQLVRAIAEPDVGAVEARQIPIEHPKDYDVNTGETSWASTACLLVRRDVVNAVRGFDAEAFFLYCDDVDFSWSVRHAGYRLVHQPAAVVFHDKQLTRHATWATTRAERYYSAEGALYLHHKWGSMVQLEALLDEFQRSDSEPHRSAAAAFVSRRDNGKMPSRIGESKVARFENGFYAKHRFTL